MTSGVVYILASKRNGALYTGITSDLHGRTAAHREGRGSEFVAKYGVHRLVRFEEHPLAGEVELVTESRRADARRWVAGQARPW